MFSVGDLAFHEGQRVLATTDDALVFVDDTGAVAQTLDPGIGTIFGLVSLGRNNLIAFAGDRVIRINDTTGDAIVIGQLDPGTTVFGAAFQGPAIHDILFGTAGNDRIAGLDGDDFLGGAAGNDNLLGGAGADSILGAGGNDRLAGGADNDRLGGGAGRDTFVFADGDGRNVVTDFRDGQDRIAFTSGADSLRDLRIIDAGANAVIRFAGGETIFLANVDAADLTAADFLFA